MAELPQRRFRWLWVAVVVALASWLGWRSAPGLASVFSTLAWGWVASSVLLTASVKLLLGENARAAAVRCGIDIGYSDAFGLYNMSQLGKYLPGSVWQYVGRAAGYRMRGASPGTIRDALLVESLWVLSGAAGVGGAAYGVGAARGLLQAHVPPALAGWLPIVAAACVIALGTTVLLARGWLRRVAVLARPGPRVIVVQVLVWIGLGLAFWCVLRATAVPGDPVLAVGLFAIAYAAGFVVMFAPAGLGVRDAVLLGGLMPIAPMEAALAATVVARLVYMAVDLGLALSQALFHRRPVPR